MENIKTIFIFIQDQIISMKWLNALIGNILNNFAMSETLKGVIQFFVYDVIKIFILLSVLIFCISYIQSYFPPERTKKILGRFNGISANILAALFGTVTPFCSCSSIPLFIGFTSAGIPISMTFSLNQVKQTIKKVYLYIFIGVGIGAFIHNVIPEAWINAILGKNNWYSVPLASLVGIPMYADIFGTLPIAESLYYKGAGLGTILSFMMSVTALSLPSMIMIKKVVKMPLLIVFVGIVTVGIIIIGYLFNAFYFI